MLDSLILVASALDRIGVDYVFLGGSIVPWLLEDPGSMTPRTTEDVDAALEVVTLAKMISLEELLRKEGFQNDTRPGAPVCRWIYRGIVVDLMASGLPQYGLKVDYFPEAIKERVLTKVGSANLNLISASYFVLLKLLAFHDRGKRDWMASHDIEDVVSVINGRSAFPSMQSTLAKQSLANSMNDLEKLVGDMNFLFATHLRSDRMEQSRIPLLVGRWKDLHARIAPVQSFK